MTEQEKQEMRERWRLLIDWADIAYFTGAGFLAGAGFMFAKWAGLAIIGGALIAWALITARR